MINTTKCYKNNNLKIAFISKMVFNLAKKMPYEVTDVSIAVHFFSG
ncbi:Hypothetical protein I595_2128 [Croceitalea dokdonensis DOKDO 023]|uniref:Uncharacterized protein n=1 Tax=Croceitalea dokdonensis DOKDO 023 TaxID=1300341 RepID=A0A0P7A553_9FLAO|nr:Hypothetical protein I595_2128 [Croceitalea dokdonensis DOKDO 023]